LDKGYIKLHRKICKWEWFADPSTFALFIHLLLKANHEDKKWRGMVVKRGQLVTGRKALSEEIGLSEQQIRTSLTKLKSTSELTIQSTNRYSLVTLTNYDSYQVNSKGATSQSTSHATNKQPTSNHKQEVKEVKEVKKRGANGRFIPPKPTEVQSYLSSLKEGSFTGETFCDFYQARGWVLSNGKKMCDWKAAVRTWRTRRTNQQSVIDLENDWSRGGI
jgi:hypothetical protein